MRVQLRVERRRSSRKKSSCTLMLSSWTWQWLLKAFVRQYFKLPTEATLQTAPQLKLAHIPSKAELVWGVDEKGRKALYPSVRVRNVVVFPGIPSLLQKAFGMLRESLRSAHGASLHHRRVYLSCDEFAIAATLTGLQDEMRPRGLAIGSYPKIGHSYYRVKVTLDGLDEAVVDEAQVKLRSKLPDSIVHYDESPLANALAKFETLRAEAVGRDPAFSAKLEEAVRLVDETLEGHDLDSLCLSFNGGKDCTALLHLLWLRHAAMGRLDDATKHLTALYIRPRNPFPAMDAFVHESVERYSLELVELSGDIREQLGGLKDSRPSLKFIFMGTRATDPNAKGQGPVATTDPGWPSFTRVNPLYHFAYADIWRLIRGLWLPYASLYDEGYTSIGGRDSTEPNPALATLDNFGLRRFKPAHTLSDPGLERAGRK